MKKRYGSSLILMLLCVLFAAAAANAEWVRNGVPVCSADDGQQTPMIVPDGANGAIVVWADYRTGNDWDIYGNRITGDGFVLGGPGDVPACTAAGYQTAGGIVLDGVGGVIVV